VGQHLDIPSNIASIKNGQEFKSEVAMFCLETLTEILPPIWQPMAIRIKDVISLVAFATPSGEFKEYK